MTSLHDTLMDPEKMKAAALDAARFSSFAQRVKMAYWRTLKNGDYVPPERVLDTVLLEAWQDMKNHPYEQAA